MDKIAECIFSFAFDSMHASFRLFSLSKVMLTLIASSFSLFVDSIVEVSEGERFASREQMMEGTPLPPFLEVTFGSRRCNNVFNNLCAFKYSHKYRMYGWEVPEKLARLSSAPLEQRLKFPKLLSSSSASYSSRSSSPLPLRDH